MNLSPADRARVAAAVAAAPRLTTDQITELRRILRPDDQLILAAAHKPGRVAASQRRAA